MRHDQLQDAGRETHREIDQRLPTHGEKQTLANLVRNRKLELVADANTGFDQDDNWRIRLATDGHLYIEQRSGGSWVEQARFEA